MGSAIFIGIFAAWLLAVWKMTGWVSGRPSRRQSVLRVVAFVALLILPVADELATWPVFMSLCHQGTRIKIDDTSPIRGKTARLEASPINERMPVGFVPILRTHFAFKDVATGAVIAHYDTYVAGGGWLSRVTNFPEGGGS